jgi:pseudouridine synthase
MERLQKFLAAQGVASRRHAEELIRQGKITVNGAVVRDMGVKIEPGRDYITVGGRAITPESKKVYLMLNKPAGILVTAHDTHHRKTVLDLIGDVGVRVFPVGRLDKDTEGLLLLTNDGDLSFALTHPSREVTKEYHATVVGVPEEQQLGQFRQGIIIEGRRTAPAQVDIIKSGNGYAILRVRIHEGRKRQVRRMCQAIGHPVSRLLRVQLGPLTMEGLAPGSFRHLSEKELSALQALLPDWSINEK